MLKQQTVATSLGPLTVSAITLGELRQLDCLFTEPDVTSGPALFLRYLPLLFFALRKVHRDLTPEQLEGSLTFEDFNALFTAVLEVSGLTRAVPGEAAPVAV
ncbi:MAG: hypothetical protein ACRD4F_01485 [Candidatus Angelobacter sp.]